MGETTIEWADFTHNFHVGCTKVSPGCDHCYAETWAKRAGTPELWAGERRRTSVSNWAKPHKWNREEGVDFLEGMRTSRPRVFTNSLADFFDNQIPVQWRRDAWHVIDQTPNLDWLILTKRPQNIAKMLPEPDAGYSKPWGNGWPNVWLGTTAENQEEANRRIPELLQIQAAVLFVSAEPLLGELDLTDIKRWNALMPSFRWPSLNWIITGGESGPGARPFNPDYARKLRDQCADAKISFFMKQMGGKRKPFPPIPDDLMVREFPFTCGEHSQVRPRRLPSPSQD